MRRRLRREGAGGDLLRDEFPHETKVKRGDSIIERLYNLLVKLHELDIEDGMNDQGWDAYFVPRHGASPLTAENIVWNQVVLAGFSQGASHTGFWSKWLPLRGAIIIDSGLGRCLDLDTGDILPDDWLRDPVDASAGGPRFGIGHREGKATPDVALPNWNLLGMGIGDEIDDGIVTFPPGTAAFTGQVATSVMGCGAHLSMAEDECMPSNPVSGASSNQADETHLFRDYLLRFYCADDDTGCR